LAYPCYCNFVEKTDVPIESCEGQCPEFYTWKYPCTCILNDVDLETIPGNFCNGECPKGYEWEFPCTCRINTSLFKPRLITNNQSNPQTTRQNQSNSKEPCEITCPKGTFFKFPCTCASASSFFKTP
jgi:hypothetical protein